MKKHFVGHYQFTSENFNKLSSNSLFVFDTNVLLGLYRYNKEDCDELKIIFKEIQDVIWIPYQIGKEFFNNIDCVKNTYTNSADSVVKNFEDALKTMKERSRSLKSYAYDFKKEIEIISKAIEDVKGEIKNKKDKLKKEQEDFNLIDYIINLYEGKVSDEPTGEELNGYIKEAIARFENKIPPGYKDKNKSGENIYGDFIIWKEMIKKSKSVNKNIIFITDDKKEDWYSSSGPRKELISEFYKETNGNLFYAYTFSKFIKNKDKIIKTNINESTIGNIEKIENSKFKNTLPYSNMYNSLSSVDFSSIYSSDIPCCTSISNFYDSIYQSPLASCLQQIADKEKEIHTQLQTYVERQQALDLLKNKLQMYNDLHTKSHKQ